MHLLFFIGVNVLQPLLISRFINDLTNIAGKTLDHFVSFIWLWLGLHLLQTTIGRIGIYTWFTASAYTLRDIDIASFKATLSHGSDFFNNNFTGSLVTKFNRFTRSFDLISTATMFDLLSVVVQFVFPFIVLLFIAPPIAFIMLGWTIVFTTILIYLHKKKLKRARVVSALDSKITGIIADAITNALSIKMFTRFGGELRDFENISDERVRARFRNLVFGDFIRLFKVVFIIMLEIPVFLLSAKYAIEGKVNVGQIVLIQLYIQQLLRSLWDLGKLVEKLEEALADATEMAEIYALPADVQDPVRPKKLTNVKGRIKFEGVHFTYKGDNEHAVFTDLNLDFPVGQKIGLVGPSGGGKSTFTKLLLRFNDVTSGRITIDGHDISKTTQDDLRKAIAYVPQEPLLFHRSIYDNIAYGQPNAKHQDILEAARLAHAEEFISKLPKQYDTLVGERGVKLSGGQKQRIAIARAMLKKAPILILDEATSALDSKSEKHIQAALNNLMKNRTTLVIAHRLSTIRKLDRIIVLKDGTVLEDGTHEQLLVKKGLYAELWGHQQGDFLED